MTPFGNNTNDAPPIHLREAMPKQKFEGWLHKGEQIHSPKRKPATITAIVVAAQQFYRIMISFRYRDNTSCLTYSLKLHIYSVL